MIVIKRRKIKVVGKPQKFKVKVMPEGHVKFVLNKLSAKLFDNGGRTFVHGDTFNYFVRETMQRHEKRAERFKLELIVNGPHRKKSFLEVSSYALGEYMKKLIKHSFELEGAIVLSDVPITVYSQRFEQHRYIIKGNFKIMKEIINRYTKFTIEGLIFKNVDNGGYDKTFIMKMFNLEVAK